MQNEICDEKKLRISKWTLNFINIQINVLNKTNKNWIKWRLHCWFEYSVGFFFLLFLLLLMLVVGCGKQKICMKNTIPQPILFIKKCYIISHNILFELHFGEWKVWRKNSWFHFQCFVCACVCMCVRVRVCVCEIDENCSNRNEMISVNLIYFHIVLCN